MDFFAKKKPTMIKHEISYGSVVTKLNAQTHLRTRYELSWIPDFERKNSRYVSTPERKIAERSGQPPHSKWHKSVPKLFAPNLNTVAVGCPESHRFYDDVQTPSSSSRRSNNNTLFWIAKINYVTI